MKLLFINQIETCAGWGFETFLNRALLENEVTTICVDYQKNAYSLATELLKIDEDFDAVLLERGCGYRIPLEILKAIDRPKVFLFTELIARNPNEFYLLNSGMFEHIFFRSLPCIDWIVSQNWIDRERVSLFLSAIDPGFYDGITPVDKDIDILFIGTLLPRRQKIIAEIENEFVVTTHSAFGRDMVDLVNRAKIILNIHGEEFLDTETRVYETLACKGFLLTEKLSAESPFKDGVHLVESTDTQDLKAKIAYYLKDEIGRETIAESGYREAIANHTFQVRVKQIEQVMDIAITTRKPSKDPLDRQALARCVRLESFYKVRDKMTMLTRRYLSVVKQRIVKTSHLLYKK
ncbi:glycosyltransferase [Chamaesiphon polymorphus]|uniref:Glycosyltransferase family 1 protein n=1 Tax=Chamaesiphon polymorphus CCALA 037 TaxID=2107692 RepID=A0A2T1GMC1_9CYAN|nr:glycosyltransferase [Chamaesiphon polymorphus]PSB59040.1 glycosyltransferase family 1 protein [Chamaesiphon polymorphus CCALA 037]